MAPNDAMKAIKSLEIRPVSIMAVRLFDRFMWGLTYMLHITYMLLLMGEVPLYEAMTPNHHGGLEIRAGS